VPQGFSLLLTVAGEAATDIAIEERGARYPRFCACSTRDGTGRPRQKNLFFVPLSPTACHQLVNETLVRRNASI
jgi:hypothetical protein